MMILKDNLVIGSITGECFYVGIDKEDAERWLNNKKALRRRRENIEFVNDIGFKFKNKKGN